MKRCRFVMVPLLISAAMLATAAAHAQARGPSSREPGKVAKTGEALQELEDWLGRLVGSYRVEGRLELDAGLLCGKDCVARAAGAFVEDGRLFHARSPTGVANCTRIGAGAGIHCIINVPWQTQYFTPTVMGTVERRWPEVGTLAPAMLLLGIDPEKQEISYFQVDDQSAAWWSQGPVKSEGVRFGTPCVNGPKSVKCERAFAIHAPRHGRHIELKLDIKLYGVKWANYRLILRRLPDDQPE